MANQADAQSAVLQLVADGGDLAMVEDLVSVLEDHCGDVLAALRVALDQDKVRAASAGVGAAAVLARLQREFFLA